MDVTHERIIARVLSAWVSTRIAAVLARTTGQVQGPLGDSHRCTACSSAAELLAGDAAADVEQMVLGVVQCVSDDGGRVDHLIS